MLRKTRAVYGVFREPFGVYEPRGAVNVAKRTRPAGPPSSEPALATKRQARPGIVHTSVYLPEAMYEGLREAAFKERRKIHDIVLEGISAALRKRGWRG
jgi:hypothetical protein